MLLKRWEWSVLLGYEIVYNEEDSYVVLVGKEGTFEISESDVEDLSNNSKSFLNF